jgi:hypothetical protein
VLQPLPWSGICWLFSDLGFIGYQLKYPALLGIQDKVKEFQ